MEYEIEKFDGERNFTVWKVRMEAILAQKGWKKALLGKERMPSTLTEEQKNEMDKKALSLIQLSLSDSVLMEVLSEKTASDLWLKLESLWQSRSPFYRRALKYRLYKLRMAKGTSIKAHIKEFESILDDLASVDVILEEEDKAIRLLSSLPPSLAQSLEILTICRDSISLEDVKAALLRK